eukprot:906995_1
MLSTPNKQTYIRIQQHKHRNVFSFLSKWTGPVWYLSKQSEKLLTVKHISTSIDIKKKITELNKISQNAFNKAFRSRIRTIFIGTLASSITALLLSAVRAIDIQMTGIWFLVTIVSACLYFINALYKTHNAAIDEVKHYISHEDAAPGFHWNVIQQHQNLLLLSIRYLHIVIKQNTSTKGMKDSDLHIHVPDDARADRKQDEGIEVRKLTWADRVGSKRESWIRPLTDITTTI